MAPGSPYKVRRYNDGSYWGVYDSTASIVSIYLYPSYYPYHELVPPTQRTRRQLRGSKVNIPDPVDGFRQPKGSRPASKSIYHQIHPEAYWDLD